MRKIELAKSISGTAATSVMSAGVSEDEGALHLFLTANVDRDCMVGEDKAIYRREFAQLIQDAMDAYYRTA